MATSSDAGVKYEPKPPQQPTETTPASAGVEKPPHPPASGRSSVYCALTNPRRALAILLRETATTESSQTEQSDGSSAVSHVKSRFRTRMILNEIFSVKDLATLVPRESEFRHVVLGNEMRQRNNIHTMKLDAIRRIDEQHLVDMQEVHGRTAVLAEECRDWSCYLAVDAHILEEFLRREAVVKSYPPDSLVRMWYAVRLRHIETTLEPEGRFDKIVMSETLERDESFVRYQIDLDECMMWVSAKRAATIAMQIDAHTIAALQHQRMIVESQELAVRDELQSMLLHDLFDLNFDALRSLRLAPKVDVSGNEKRERQLLIDAEQSEFSSVLMCAQRHRQYRKHSAEHWEFWQHELLCRNTLLSEEERIWFELLRSALREWHDTYVADCVGIDDRKRFDQVEHRTRVDIVRQFISESSEILNREVQQRNEILTREWQRAALYNRFADGYLALQQQEFIHVKAIASAFHVAIRSTQLVSLTAIVTKEEATNRVEIELFRDESLARMYKPWIALRFAYEDEPVARSNIVCREQVAFDWVLDALAAARYVDARENLILAEVDARLQVWKDQLSDRRVIRMYRFQWFCENRVAHDNEQIALFEEKEDAHRIQIEDAEKAARHSVRLAGLVTFALADRSHVRRQEIRARALIYSTILFNVEVLCRDATKLDELAERVPLIQSSLHDIELVSRIDIQKREQAKFDAILAVVNAPNPLFVAFEAEELRARLSIMFDGEVSLNAQVRNAKSRKRVDYRSNSVVELFVQSIGNTVDEYFCEVRQTLEHVAEPEKRRDIQFVEQHRFSSQLIQFAEAAQRTQIEESEISFLTIFDQSRSRIERNETRFFSEAVTRTIDHVETGMRNALDISSRASILEMLSAADEHYVAQRKRYLERILREEQEITDKHLIGCIVIADEESRAREGRLEDEHRHVRAKLSIRPPLCFNVALHSIQLSLLRADFPTEHSDPFTVTISTAGDAPTSSSCSLSITREINAGHTHVIVLTPPEGTSPASFDLEQSNASKRCYVEVRRGERLVCCESLLVESSALDGGVLSFVMTGDNGTFAKVILLANVQ